MRPGDIGCPPPNREPHRPRVALPPLACDTHAHILGPEARFPYDEGRIYTPPDSTLCDYLRLLSTLGVERAVAVQPSVYATDNRALLDALAEVKQGLRGVAVVDPAIGKTALSMLDAAGVRGVRLNLVDRREGRNQVPADEIRALARKIAPFGWHIELLVNVDEAPSLAALLSGLPVPIAVGHLGYPRSGTGSWASSENFEAFLSIFAGGQVWVKLTGPYRITGAPDLPYADVTPLARRLAAVNPERLLWGTDWPHVMMKKPMPNDGDLTDLVSDWLPDAALLKRVCVDNPARLYGFQDMERLPRSNPQDGKEQRHA